jgi:peptidoglycan-associated lipoprotein
MQASKEKYYNDVNRASSMGLDPLKTCKDTNMVADFNLKTTKVNLEFEIQFVFDREIVLPQYMDTVKNLQTILEDNPKTVVEIGAHTDARGNDDYNQRLSDRRANEIVRLLVEAGIPKARLTPKGYGETEPRKLLKNMKGLKSGYIFTKDTVLTEPYINELKKTEGEQVFEDAHTINRRVSLKIVSEDFKASPAKQEEED